MRRKLCSISSSSSSGGMSTTTSVIVAAVVLLNVVVDVRCFVVASGDTDGRITGNHTDKGNSSISSSVNSISGSEHNSHHHGNTTVHGGHSNHSSHGDTTEFPVLVVSGNSTGVHHEGKNETQHHHHHHQGKEEEEHVKVSNNSTECGSGAGRNKTAVDDAGTTDKIEQILFDIFVDEDDVESNDDDEEDDEDELSSSYHRDKEDETDDQRDVSTNESEVEGMIAPELSRNEKPKKSVSKRSTDSETSTDDNDNDASTDSRVSRGRETATDKRKRQHQQATNRRNSNSKKGVPSRGHSRPRSKPKSSTKSSKKPTNVNKYNEYMDVVLKRMNSMIKTKQMDPLMVNLFSGAGGGNSKKKPESGGNNGGGKKKKKKSPTGWKKRKGAKNNKARIDDQVLMMEGRSASSDSSDSSSDTVELDNNHEVEGQQQVGVVGPGGVFIRRVGVDVRENSSDEVDEDRENDDDEDDGAAEEEEYSEKSFREIRALIVNGSMIRSPSSKNDQEPSDDKSVSTPKSQDTPRMTNSDTPVPAEEEEEARKKKKNTPSSSSVASNKKKPSDKKKQQEKKKKNKKKVKKAKPTRGVLKGLSSLKRSGNVDVVRQNNNVRVVRGKFTLGPVTLEIVPRGKGKVTGRKKNKKDEDDDEKDEEEKRSPVTAVARELKGVIEVRLKKNSATTIKRLRVFPPSSVKIKPSSIPGGNKQSNKSPVSPGSVPRYSRVTPVATHRLRQIASAVVRQADLKRKSSNLEQDGSSKTKRKN